MRLETSAVCGVWLLLLGCGSPTEPAVDLVTTIPLADSITLGTRSGLVTTIVGGFGREFLVTALDSATGAYVVARPFRCRSGCDASSDSTSGELTGEQVTDVFEMIRKERVLELTSTPFPIIPDASDQVTVIRVRARVKQLSGQVSDPDALARVLTAIRNGIDARSEKTARGEGLRH